MVEAADNPIAEADLQQLMESVFRPFRIWNLGGRFHDFIRAQVPVRDDPDPALHGVLSSFSRRAMPFVDAAVRCRQSHWPKRQNALPVDRGVEHFRHDLSGNGSGNVRMIR